MKWVQKVNEFIYAISTHDKYSDFDSTKSFNRVNGPESEASLLFSQNSYSTHSLGGGGSEGDDFGKEDVSGVHEVRLAWRHVKLWFGKNMPELWSSLQHKCTSNDIKDFQKDLGIKLPFCVVEFFKTTDGQSNFGTIDTQSGGLIYGLKLMPLDEITAETENWRKVAKAIGEEMMHIKQSDKVNELSKLAVSHNNDMAQFKKSYSYGNSSRESLQNFSASTSSLPQKNDTPLRYLSNMPKQRSIPPGAIHTCFAHPMWIPIVTDEVGNYIGIDLSPPSDGPGKWGQVILFGRDFDTKYKIADNWGDFLLMFANELEMGNWSIKISDKVNDDEFLLGSNGDLIYRDRDTKKESSYLAVLRERCVQQWLSEAEREESPSDEVRDLIKEFKYSTNKTIPEIDNVDTRDKYISQNLQHLNELKPPNDKQ